MTNPSPATAMTLDTEFKRGLGLYDSTMVVVGSMIGSGIFIVSADIARQVQSPGLLLMTWIVTAALTITAALSYGELAGRCGKPRAARAVGTVMARNPLCLLVPCHRVVRADGSIGGFRPLGRGWLAR